MTFTINGNTLKKYEGNEEHVIIPDGVEAIADYAFYGAQKLRTVTFPDSLKEIGSDVFYDCEELIEADIPDSVYYMGYTTRTLAIANLRNRRSAISGRFTSRRLVVCLITPYKKNRTSSANPIACKDPCILRMIFQIVPPRKVSGS